MESLRKMVDDESELVTIYYGEDVTEEDAERHSPESPQRIYILRFECHECLGSRLRIYDFSRVNLGRLK